MALKKITPNQMKKILITLSIALLMFTACGGPNLPDITVLLEEPIPSRPAEIPEAYYETLITRLEDTRETIKTVTDPSEIETIYTAYLDLGNIYRDLNENEKAITGYEKAIEAGGGRGLAAWLSKGALLERIGEYKEAEKAYREIISVGANEQAHFRLALLLRQHTNGSESEIREVYENSLTLFGYFTNSAQDYLIYLVEIGDTARADEIVDAALERDPSNEGYLKIKESYDNL